MAKRLTDIQKRLKATRSCRALRSDRGETITEVLVAMVIVGLALLMLAVVIATSSNIVKNSREDMANYYERTNALTVLQESATTPTDIEVTHMKIVVTSGDSSIKLSPDDPTTGIAVNAMVDTSNADKPVVSYEKDA